MSPQPKHALHVVPNFLTDDEIALHQGALRDAKFWLHSMESDGIISLTRYCPGFSAVEQFHEIVVERICGEMEAAYGFPLIVGNAPSFRKSLPGSELSLHIDHGKLVDGMEVIDYSTNNGNSWPRCLNEYASIVYWNDDYDGGEIYFENPRISIRPESGMLIFFPCSASYAHGVSRVHHGERIVSTHFWGKAQTAATVLHALDIKEHIKRRFWEKIRHSAGGSFWVNHVEKEIH